MTLLESARAGRVTGLMRSVAKTESVPVSRILKGVADGTVIIPRNNRRSIARPCAIGAGMSVKINANIGTSTDKPSLSEELKKLDACVRIGADCVMDLSVGGDLPKIRAAVVEHSPVPVGTVPVYEIAVNAQKHDGDCLTFGIDDILAVLEAQAAAGVDFFTIHAGATRRSLGQLSRRKRLLGVVSRGGAMLAAWMAANRKENPFYEHFDAVLDICRRYDVTVSLGDALRPGSIFDATDPAQIAELKILGQLARRCRKAGVQVMIEGPGHVPLSQVAQNMRLQKKYCDGAPFYILGPLVTDVAAGYDHIAGAIGAAFAAWQGADFLCYLTPAEHLRHPSLEDVREGVIASKIAAHAADICRGNKKALAWDRKMSVARAARDWKAQIALSVDPEKASRYRHSSMPRHKGVCSMCGEFCSIKMMERSAGVVHR